MNENSIGNWKTIVDKPANGDSLGRIDQYELIRELGGGGFGTVFLAKDTESEVDVAVKGLPPFVKNNREEMENIRSNFRIVHDLHHPHIAAALVLHPAKSVSYASNDVGMKLRVSSGDTLLVMAYAPGVTLSRWRKQFPENRVPLEKAIEITRQIADALDYAHERKVIHRDIKPANVMIETDADGKVIARVLDFGLAAEIRSSMGRVSREIHDTSGTRPYMAPEQWLGGKQGPATDQYALAVLFHELVTGEVPFASVFQTGDPVVMMNVVGREDPNLPSDLPKPVRLALAKALAKKTEERFATCGDFVKALEGTVRVSLRGAEKRSGWGWKIAACIAFFGATAGGVWYWQDVKSKEEARIVAAQKAEADRKAAEEARIALEKAQTEAAEKSRKAEESRLAAEKKAEAERKAETEKTEQAKLARDAEEAVRTKAAEQVAAQNRLEKERKEKEDAKRRAEQLRREDEQRAKKAEAARIAREIEKRKAKEAAILQNNEKTKRKLYTTLAKVETSLEKYKAFEYFDDIQSLYDSLLTGYKATKNAVEANDIEAAAEMLKNLTVPQEKIDALLPVIKTYYNIKVSVDEARKAAVAAEASRYAKESFDDAERRYVNVKSSATKKDHVNALCYLEGLSDLYKAVKKEAESNPESIYQKGLVARQAGKQNEAFAFFKQAAEKRHAAALTALGLCYLKGQGADKNLASAFSHFREASKSNYARAQYFLAGCYAKAIGVKYDKELARVWMAIAKVNGSKFAEDFLAKAGWTVSPDEERAIREVIKDGDTDVSISGSLKSALQEIVVKK